MTTIVTRAGKGSPLTHTEVDTNFTNLNTNKLETAAIPLGTLAAPSISFVGDANTGAYSPGADTLAFVTAGSNRVHITSAGLVGIGTSSPDVPLHVETTLNRIIRASSSDTGTTNNLLISNASNYHYGVLGTVSGTTLIGGDVYGLGYTASAGTDFTPVLSWTANTGRVGIGSTAPNAKLTITETANANAIVVRNADTNGSILQFGINTSIPAAYIQSAKDGSGTAQALAFYGAASEMARFDTSGRLLVGTSTVLTSGFVSIQFDGSVDNGITLKTTYASNGSNYLAFTGSGGALAGYIQQTGSTTVSYVTTSDYRLKENVSLIGDSITRLQQLKPRRFNFISEPDRIVDGFLAHEAQAVVPECVTGEKDEVDDDGTPVYQGIDQSKLVPLLTAALQEAIAKIESLEARLTAAGI